MFDFSTLIEERTQDFSGREWVFSAADQWMASSPGSRIFLISGGPGTGKTALLARLVQLITGQADAKDYPQLSAGRPVFYHFCQIQDENEPVASDNSLSPQRLIEALSIKLAEFYPDYAEALTRVGNQEIKINARQAVETVREGAKLTNIAIQKLEVGNLSARVAFEDLIRQPLLEVQERLKAAGGQGLVILVDALDEAVANNPESEFLETVLAAAHLPLDVRLIATCRPEPRVYNLLGEPALDLIRSAPQDASDIEQYARQRLSGFDQAQRLKLAGQVAASSQGNFLYAYYLLGELIENPGRLDELDALQPPENLDEIYLQFLKRELARNLERWEERFRPLLGLLAVAHRPGLSRQQLAGVAVLPLSSINDSLRACSQFLQESPAGDIWFYHPSFQNFLVENQTYQIYPAEASRKLVAYFLNEYANNWQACQDTYPLQFITSHLLEVIQAATQRTERLQLTGQLRDLFTDLTYLQARYIRTGGRLAGLVHDLEQALAAVVLSQEILVDLEGLKRILVHEAQLYDAPAPEDYPEFLAGQILYRAYLLNLDNWVAIAEKHLKNANRLYLGPGWSTAGSLLPGGDHTSVPLEAQALSNAASLSSLSSLTARPDLEQPETLPSLDFSYQSDLKSLEWTAILETPGPDPGSQASLAAMEGRFKAGPIELHWRLEREDQPSSGQPTESQAVRLLDARSILPAGEAWWKSRHLPGSPIIPSLRQMTSFSGTAQTPLGTWMIQVDEANILGYWSNLLGKSALLEPELLEAFSADLKLGGYVKVENAPYGYQQHLTIDRQQRSWKLRISPQTGPELPEYEHRMQVGAVEGRLIGAVGNVIIPDLHDFSEDWFPFIAETRVAVSPDGQYGAAANSDGSLRLVDLASGTEQARLAGHTRLVTAMLFSQDGRRLVSASLDGSVKVWRSAAAWSSWTISRAEAIPSAVCLAREDKWLFTAWSDGLFQVWDLGQESLLAAWQSQPQAGMVCKAAALQDRDWVATGGIDGSLQVWDLGRGEALFKLDGHREQILFLAAVRPGLKVVSASQEGKLVCWDLAKQGEARLLSTGLDYRFKAAFTPDGSRLLGILPDNQLAVWDTRDWSVSTRRLRPFKSLFNLLPLPDNDHFLTSGVWDPFLSCWSLASLPAVESVPAGENALAGKNAPAGESVQEESLLGGLPEAILRLDEPLSHLALAPDQKTILAGGNLGGLHCLRLAK